MLAMAVIERWPSHNFRIAAPVSFNSTAPSGYKSTDCWRTGSKSRRARRQMLGTDDGASVISKLGVRMMDRIDHHPQHLEFESQRLKCLLLSFDSRAPRHHEVESLLAVPRRLDQPTLEVLEAFDRDPAVILRERLDPLAHQVGCEKLGERRRDAFDPTPGLAEPHVRFARATHSPEHLPLVFHFLARDAKRLAKPNPHFDSTGPSRRPVVVHNSLQPQAAHIRFRTIGENRCVLSR